MEELEKEGIQIEDQWEKLFEPYRKFVLDPRMNIPDPYYLLEYKNVGFSVLGGIQAIAGQRKNGKTFLMSQLIAACLGTGNDRVNEYLPGLRVPQRTIDYLGRLPRVLYFDTEMEQDNSMQSLRRIYWLCGWDKEPHDNFTYIRLRELTGDDEEPGFKKRLTCLRVSIERCKPDVVFIDGIRDIIGNFNDLNESSELVELLMTIASKKNICIWNVLHYNPRPGNDLQSKMRGHLGTELGNKVSDTLVSRKVKKEGEPIKFIVTQEDSRGKDIDDWEFSICDGVYGQVGIPKIKDTGELQKVIDSVEEEKEIMERETVRVLKGYILAPKAEYFTDCIKKLKKELQVGDTKAKVYWNNLRVNHPTLLYQTSNQKFTMSKRDLEAYENNLPF